MVQLHLHPVVELLQVVERSHLEFVRQRYCSPGLWVSQSLLFCIHPICRGKGISMEMKYLLQENLSRQIAYIDIQSELTHHYKALLSLRSSQLEQFE